MRLKVRDTGLSTGGILIAILNEEDAHRMDLHLKDRILVRKARNRNVKTVATLDIADSKRAIPQGVIGCMEEVLKKLKLKHGDEVVVEYAKKPRGIGLIRRKLDGYELTRDDYDIIVNDIVRDELSQQELAYFIAACYTHGLKDRETVCLTKSIVAHGATLTIKGNVYDKHCIGGVPGNRTTLIVVPILAAAGLKVPKTSSRAITSPAGTADTMEIFAPVAFPLKKMQSILDKVGAFIAWGGGINLATADDKLIKVRHTMSIDPIGMLLASILAKKRAVDSNKVLIDIPVGKDTKIKSQKHALQLKREFMRIGKKIGMKVEVVLTNGEQPIGSGIGPALEAIDVLHVLQRNKEAPKDLEKKSLEMAAYMLKMAGKKNSKKLAKELLDSGKAYKKFKEIVKAQGGKPNLQPKDIRVGKFKKTMTAYKKGTLVDLHTASLARVARIAGAPLNKGAGLYLHVRQGAKVKKGDPIVTIHAQSKSKLQFALDKCCFERCYTIK
ncbi:MAG: AMP phosphorylase [Candidatus Nanoarchaeia archaeon]